MQVQALSITAKSFMAFLDAYPGALHAYQRVIANRKEELDEIMRRESHTSARRLALLMLDLAQRCGESSQHGTALPVPLSQRDLASLAKVSRATLARVLPVWRDHGLVSTQNGRMIISNTAALRRISERASSGTQTDNPGENS